MFAKNLSKIHKIAYKQLVFLKYILMIIIITNKHYFIIVNKSTILSYVHLY